MEILLYHRINHIDRMVDPTPFIQVVVLHAHVIKAQEGDDVKFQVELIDF